LCNRLNRFVLKRDRTEVFRFASLQSQFAKDTLRRFDKDPNDLDTFYVLAEAESGHARLLRRARAGLFVLHELGWPWRGMTVLGLLPTVLLDFGYDLIANYRYRLFGRYDACPMPEPRHRERFIEV